MKRFCLICTILLSSLTLNALAAEQTTTLNSDQEKLGYSIGIEIGQNLKTNFTQQGIEISPKAISAGIRDALSGQTPKLTQEQMQAALEKFQQQQETQMQAKASGLILANRKELFDSKNDPVMGNKNAAITLVEFFDYRCGHCRRMQPIIEELSKNNSNVRIVLKELPILGENSALATKAALAAKKQGKYAEFHAELLSSNEPITPESIVKLAKRNNLNIEQFLTDLESPAIMDEVEANYKLASELGIQGTPAFIIADPKVLDKAKPGQPPVSIFITGATDLQNLQQSIQQVQQQSAIK